MLKLWDGIFADDPYLGVVDYLSVSMLLFIRDARTGARSVRDAVYRSRRVLRGCLPRAHGTPAVQCCNRTTPRAWAA